MPLFTLAMVNALIKKYLKKGMKIKIYDYKTIRGKKYARIDKNKYVLVSNLASAKKKAVKKLIKVLLPIVQILLMPILHQ